MGGSGEPKAIDLKRKVLLGSLRLGDSMDSREDSSIPSDPRSTPPSVLSHPGRTDSISSESTLGKANSNKSDSRNSRPKSDYENNSDRESSGSKRNSPFMYGKSGSFSSTRSSSSNPGYAKLTTADSAFKQAEDCIRRSSQEIRRLGFGRNSYDATSKKPPPQIACNGSGNARKNNLRMSFDSSMRASQYSNEDIYLQGPNDDPRSNDFSHFSAFSRPNTADGRSYSSIPSSPRFTFDYT